MKKLLKFIKAQIFHRRLKKAIEKADRITLETGSKTLVLNHAGKPVVITKRSIKQLIHLGYFKCSAAQIEDLALYKTY
jgi:hypothetical protein